LQKRRELPIRDIWGVVMDSRALIDFLEILSTICALLTAVRMFRSGLRRRYPCLFTYLVFLVPFSFCPAVMDRRSVAYFWFWVCTDPVEWLFEVLVVRELCGLVLERYQGLRSLGRWTIYGGIGLSIAISLASLMPRIPVAVTRRSRLLFYCYGGDRGIDLALGIFLLLMILLASRYPVPLKRNLVVNAALFTLRFFATTFVALLRIVFDRRVGPPLDAGLTALSAATLVAWCFILTPKGEKDQVELARYRHEDEIRILERLDQINQWVLRLARI
jgi:hypothetical protein